MDNSINNNQENNQPFLPDGDNIDMKRYLSLFISNWYWFGIGLLISISLAYAINRYSSEVYTVTSTLLIQDDQFTNAKSGLGSIIPGGDIFKSGQNINNEIGILKSYSLNYRVIKNLPEFQIVYMSVGRRGIAETQLYNVSPFIVIPKSIESQPKNYIVKITILSNEKLNLVIDGITDVDTVIKFGARYSKNGFDFVIKLRDSLNNSYTKNELSNRYYFYFDSPERQANIYRNKLKINIVNEGASLVTMSVSGFVAQQEADYLNKLMDLYINYGLEFKNATADSTITFINTQLGIISDSLAKAEDKLKRFKLSNRILDITGEGSIIRTRIERHDNEKSAIELQLKYYDYLNDYVESKNESGDIVSPSMMGVSDQVLIELVKNLAMAQKKRKQLAFNLHGEMPAISYTDNEIELARASLKENLKNSVKSIYISLDNVNKLISDANQELMKLPETERLMIGIQRKFDLNNSVYTYLLEKRAEASIAMASTVSENRIIDRAISYNASLIRPQKGKNNSFAILFGLLIPGLLIFMIDFLNNKIIDKKDIEKSTKAPILGFISHNTDINDIPVVSKPGSTLSESFRSVRTSLKYYVKDSEPIIISVTSTISSEGKTFISVNLASIVAMLGKKVLLIGLDLRKPRIHKVFNMENEEGMSSYLSNNCEYKDVIKETSINNLFYAPSGAIPPNPAELIETDRMATFFAKAKIEFDFIIIDTPPVAVVADAFILSKYADINIFVVRQRYTSKNTLTLIDEFYKGGKFKNLAIIINDISLSGYYGYGLRYGYSIGYGYSYGYNYYGRYSYGKYGDNYSRGTYYTDDK
jgi:tyrosine-protein kinase Etk/Wzc